MQWEIMLPLKREQSAFVVNIDKPGGHYAKKNKPVGKGKIFNHHEVSKIVKLIKADNTIMIVRYWGLEKRRVVIQ